MKRAAEEGPPEAEGDDSGSSDEEGEGAAAEDPGSAAQPPGKRKRAQVTLGDGRVVSAKCRNHVNPLLSYFQKPVPIPADGDWGKVFRDPSKPIVLDVGCAKGRFCLEGAKRFPEFNWLGIEIREALVVRANQWVEEQQLSNLHYIFGNASAGVADLVKSMPAGVLRRVTILCPDPCFKKKHQKRRMVTDRLAEELGAHMPLSSVLFVESDVEQVAMHMADTVAATNAFVRIEALPDASSAPGAPVAPLAHKRATAGRDYQSSVIAGGDWEHKGAGAVGGSYQWLLDNPLGLMSERESSTISRGLPMFRALFQRSAAAPPTEAASPAEAPAAPAAAAPAVGAATAAD